MTIDEIKEKVKKNQYEYTLHAEIERRADDLTFYQIEEAILTGTCWNDTRMMAVEKAACWLDFQRIFRFMSFAEDGEKM